MVPLLWCTSGTPPLPFWTCLRVSLRSAPLGGKGLLAFLDFPHNLPHTVWVAVVSREQGGSPTARRYGLSPLGRLFFPAIVAASRNNPIFPPDSRLTHKRKYGRTPNVPRKASFKAEESSLRGTVVGGCRVVVVAGKRRTRVHRWTADGYSDTEHRSESRNHFRWRKSLTSAWRRSMSSTRRTPEH